NGRMFTAACCALRIFDAATICMALVICAVVRTDWMRRRRSRVLRMSTPTPLELLDRRAELRGERVTQDLFARDLPQQVRLVGGQEVGEAILELLDALHG